MSDEHVYKIMDKIYKPHKDGKDKLDITTDRRSSNHEVNLNQKQANNNRYHEYIKYSRVIVQILIYIVASLTKLASAYITKKIQDTAMLIVNKIYVLIEISLLPIFISFNLCGQSQQKLNESFYIPKSKR